MTEKKLRQKVRESLVKPGVNGLLWFPPKVKYYDNDIWGVFDCVYFCNNVVTFIQITTVSNLAARRKKILAKFKNLPPQNSVIWAWDDKKNDFKIETVRNLVNGY